MNHKYKVLTSAIALIVLVVIFYFIANAITTYTGYFVTDEKINKPTNFQLCLEEQDITLYINSANSKKTLENLTKAGALDSLGTERNAVLHTMDDLLRVSSAIKRTAHNHQAGLFAAAPLRPAIRLVAAPAATAEERLAWEKELLGLYLTDHPLNGHQKKLNGKKMTAIRDALRLHEDGATLCIAGIVAKIQRITTKKGDPMLFAKIEDLSDAMEVLVFSDTLKTTLPFWREGSVVKIRGRLSTRNGEPKLICNEVKELT